MKIVLNSWWIRLLYILCVVGFFVFLIDGWQFYTHKRARYAQNEDYLQQSICTNAAARAMHEFESECATRRIENETAPIVLAIQHVLDTRIFRGILGEFFLFARLVMGIFLISGAVMGYDMYYTYKRFRMMTAPALLPDFEREKIKDS